jgi:hypothetical protein
MSDTSKADNISPEYTGKETDPDTKVSVWVLTPALGTSFDVLWFKTHDEAMEHVEDNYHDLHDLLYEATKDGWGEITIRIERREVTAEDAAGVFGE